MGNLIVREATLECIKGDVTGNSISSEKLEIYLKFERMIHEKDEYLLNKSQFETEKKVFDETYSKFDTERTLFTQHLEDFQKMKEAQDELQVSLQAQSKKINRGENDLRLKLEKFTQREERLKEDE